MTTPPGPPNQQPPHQQPQGQSPQGVPPQGQPAGAMPPPYPGSPDAQGPQKKSKKKMLLIGIPVAVVAIGAAVFFLGGSEASKASVGDCMRNEGSMTDADMKTVDCDSSDAEYEVTGKHDGDAQDQCDAGTLPYMEGSSRDDIDLTLCLQPLGD